MVDTIATMEAVRPLQIYDLSLSLVKKKQVVVDVCCDVGVQFLLSQICHSSKL